MAFTQDQLDAIDLAIAGGTLRVRIGEKDITYRSMDELLKARAVIANGVDGASRRQPRHQLADFSDD